MSELRRMETLASADLRLWRSSRHRDNGRAEPGAKTIRAVIAAGGEPW